MRKIINLLRIKSWIKNGFVIFPALFSDKLMSIDTLLIVFLSFITFSLMSSVIYVINDIQDLEEDKIHPRKRYRPLPSGEITVQQAYLLGISILLLNLFISFSFFQSSFLIIIAYFTLNIAYVFKLKHIVLIDCFVIAVNFVLRVIYGSYTIGVSPSKWIITVTFFMALFLAFIKRRSECLVLKEKAEQHRKVLKEYTLEFLNPVIIICASIVLFSYLMYCFDASVLFNQKSDISYYSVIFVALGVFRYLQINYNENYNNEGDPTQLVYKDRILQMVIIGWLLFLLFIMY